jgi:hypothetical protein
MGWTKTRVRMNMMKELDPKMRKRPDAPKDDSNKIAT